MSENSRILGLMIASLISDDDLAKIKTIEDAALAVTYVMHPKDVGDIREAAIEAIYRLANPDAVQSR